MIEKRVFHVVKNVGNNKMVLFGIFTNKTILMNVLPINNYFFDIHGKKKLVNIANINKYFSESKKTMKIYNNETNEITFSICPITMNNINPEFKGK